MDRLEIRKEIDTLDDQLTGLFVRRMELCGQMADYKIANNLPLLDRGRERDIVSRVTENCPEEMQSYVKSLFNQIFDLSRDHQAGKMRWQSTLPAQIEKALQETPQLFPAKATVACQGREGAYAQFAADRLFSMPRLMYFNSFADVIRAVDKGLCQYGVLPIENILHGSVNEVYDLIGEENRFYIVRTVRLQVHHSLLTRRKTDLSAIREVISHEQALGQCAGFLKTLGPNVKVTVCENTAAAAKLVAESDREDLAAIASSAFAEQYGLHVVASGIQDSDNNYTRFICIAKNMQIFPGASRISILFRLAHRPGSLASLLSRLAAHGLNLTKLESRPIPGLDFEFTFYADIEASVYDEGVRNLLAELDASPETFVFLGSYSEL